MRKIFLSIVAIACVTINLQSQNVVWQPETIKALTSEWTGERTPDGRPKVSDELLERLKALSMEEVWGTLRRNGYENQFENFASTYENGWEILHPDQVMTGRVLTAQFMPLRKDFNAYVQKQAEKEGTHIPITNYAPITELLDGDVYVADGFGKIDAGTLMGATLATAIYSRTGTGVIFNGSARDLETVKQLEGFNAFVRDFHPSFLEEMVVMGLNTPIRIGGVMVMPGDLVIAKEEGVLFVPAHLAEHVVSIAEFVSLKDQFGFEAVKKRMYTSGEIDGQWTEKIKEDFLKWLEGNPELGSMTKNHLDKVLSTRTW